MKMHAFLALILVMTSAPAYLVTCSSSNQDEKSAQDSSLTMTDDMSTERTYIRILESANYREDFQLAIESGDERFIGVMGYSVQVPGVPDYNERYGKDHGVKIIEGTSDDYPDSVSLARSAFFDEYARGYNELLIRHIEEKRQ